MNLNVGWVIGAAGLSGSHSFALSRSESSEHDLSGDRWPFSMLVARHAVDMDLFAAFALRKWCSPARVYSPRLSFTAISISCSDPGGLDGGVAEQELDLLEIAAVLPTQFRAGATEIVGAEAFDPDLLR